MNLQPIVALQIKWWSHKIVEVLSHLFQLQLLQNEHSLHEHWWSALQHHPTNSWPKEHSPKHNYKTSNHLNHMGVEPKIVGFPPKWMVKIMENPIKMDDLGGNTHYFWKHPYFLHQRPASALGHLGPWFSLRMAPWSEKFGEQMHPRSMENCIFPQWLLGL